MPLAELGISAYGCDTITLYIGSRRIMYVEKDFYIGRLKEKIQTKNLNTPMGIHAFLLKN